MVRRVLWLGHLVWISVQSAHPPLPPPPSLRHLRLPLLQKCGRGGGVSVGWQVVARALWPRVELQMSLLD